MGILAEPIAFMRALNLPKGFSVCELGDQWVTCQTPHYLAEGLYREMGAKRYASLDANGRGTLTVDLNHKWTAKLKPFDLVTDFGTGEHIFDQAQVWRTIHKLTKPGGYIAFDRPAQGYPGHCFYRTDECLFRDLAEANSYAIVALEHGMTTRGELIRGIFRTPVFGHVTKFQNPYQGRYQKSRSEELAS